MDKINEFAIIEDSMKKYEDSLKKQINELKRRISRFSDLKIQDTDEFNKLKDNLKKITQYEKKLEECSNAVDKAKNISMRAFRPFTNLGEKKSLEEENEVENMISEFKNTYSSVIQDSFYDLAYESSLLPEHEDYKEDLESYHDIGHIDDKNYKALQYGSKYFTKEEKENENKEIEENKEDTLNYKKLKYEQKNDRGDNSYEELKKMKGIIEQYKNRAEIDFNQLKEYYIKNSEYEKLEKIKIEYDRGIELENKLNGIEMQLFASASLDSEKANKILENSFSEFKRENFDDIAVVMSDSFESLKSYLNNEYNADLDFEMDASIDDKEICLNEALKEGRITKDDYDRFIYTIGYNDVYTRRDDSNQEKSDEFSKKDDLGDTYKKASLNQSDLKKAKDTISKTKQQQQHKGQINHEAEGR